eukprot:Skav225308  [mRNA]  locus=scaffold23:63154:63951:- [translate_table: standard]
MDLVLSEYIGFLWEEGLSRNTAGDTLSGLQHHQPSLKGHLKTSWRYFRAWQQAEVPARAPPLSQKFLAILCGWALSAHPQFALALQLGFHCLLRTGELMHVQAKDVTVTGEHLHVYLGQTKTSFRNANVDAVHVQHRHLAALLLLWKQSVHKDAYLLSMSPTSFRTLFNKALSATGLDTLGIKPYSLRRGGATQLFSTSQSYSTVTQVGRWSSERTVRIYIADSLALLNDISMRLTPMHYHCLRLWSFRISELERSFSKKKGGRG